MKEEGVLTVYDYSRAWFDFCFENPEKVNTNHTAIFFFALEHKNRLGWKDKFGFPTQMAMDALGIKKHQTYIKYFNEICEWGFFILIQKSSNQYSANIISLSNGLTKNGKSLDKAIIKHRAKQTETIGQSTGQSNSSIDKQVNKETINKETITNNSDATAPVADKVIFNSVKTSFLDFYKKNLKTDYFFEAKDGSKIKTLLKKIEFQVKAKCKEKEEIFDPDTLPLAFEYFINQAYLKSDKWVIEHFTLTTLDSKFNDIFTLIQNGKRSSTNNSTDSDSKLSPAQRAAALYD